MSKKGLGKGLGALIKEDANLKHLIEEKQEGEKVLLLNLDEISPNPYQPRREFDQQELENLAESIKEQGLLQPIVVRRKNGKYELIAGERRLRATKLAGFSQISALVRSYSDTESMSFALLENLQRMDLNPMEVAGAYVRLMKEAGLTQEELAKKLGVNRSKIANSVRLLNLPSQVQEYIRRGDIQESGGRALAGLPDIKMMIDMAQRAVDEHWSVKNLEDNVAAFKAKLEEERHSTNNPDVKQENKKRPLNPIDSDLEKFVREMEHFSGEKVEVVSIPGSKAKVLGFKFVTQDDLRRIYSVFTKIMMESKGGQQSHITGPKKFTV